MTDRVIIHFKNKDAFWLWLGTNYSQASGVWLQIAKKGSGVESITYAEALDCALCYGWIDGQKASLDEKFFLQYFVKRKKDSIWSQVNKAKVAELTSQGLMREPGLMAVEIAKQNGRWDSAYQPPSSREIPPELKSALDSSPKAMAFFEGLDSQNRFAFVFRSTQAKKPETRAKTILKLIDMLERGEVFYRKD